MPQKIKFRLNVWFDAQTGSSEHKCRGGNFLKVLSSSFKIIRNNIRRSNYKLKEGKMLIWSIVLLMLGVAAFLDSLFAFGEIFRTVNSILFMLVSLGLLVRTSAKMRQASREGLTYRIKQLEEQVEELSHKKERVEVS